MIAVNDARASAAEAVGPPSIHEKDVCLPTAPRGCQPDVAATSVRRRFMGSLRTSHCLPLLHIAWEARPAQVRIEYLCRLTTTDSGAPESRSMPPFPESEAKSDPSNLSQRVTANSKGHGKLGAPSRFETLSGRLALFVGIGERNPSPTSAGISRERFLDVTRAAQPGFPVDYLVSSCAARDRGNRRLAQNM
jgi:hypothetical protein